MPVTPDNLGTYLSGGSSNTAPASAIGGAISATKVSETTPLHNIFDKVTGDESESGKVNYRIIYIKNDHATLDAEDVKIHLTAVHDSGTQSLSQSKDIAYAVSEAIDASAQTLTNEDTSPGALTWDEGESRADGILIGTLTHGQVRAVYLRRIIAPGAAAADAASFTVNVTADTGA